MGQRPSYLRERKNRSAIMIGLDHAGKTTILCHMCGLLRRHYRHAYAKRAASDSEKRRPRSRRERSGEEDGWGGPQRREQKQGVVMRTVPTVPMQLVEFKRENVRWAVWDMSGQGRYRDVWEEYLRTADALIFVVDVSDVARIAVAKDELHRLLEGQRAQSARMPLLILANKADLRGKQKPQQLVLQQQLQQQEEEEESMDGMEDAERDCMSADTVGLMLGVETIYLSRPVRVFSVSGKTGAGIEEALVWLTALVR